MATEVHQFTVVIPANTLKATPFKQTLTLDNRIVQLVGLDVQHGPSGLMGFYIAHSGTQILPQESGQFFVWDNVEKEWPLDDLPQSQGFQVVGYNLDGQFDHAVTVRLHTVYPDVPVSNVPTITFVSTTVAADGVVL